MPLPGAVSLAHAGGWVATAADPTAGALGVDIEVHATAAAALAGADLVLAAHERHVVAEAPDPAAAFARLWTRREACFKAGATESPYDLAAGPGLEDTAFGLHLWTLEPVPGVVLSLATDVPDEPVLVSAETRLG